MTAAPTTRHLGVNVPMWLGGPSGTGLLVASGPGIGRGAAHGGRKNFQREVTKWTDSGTVTVFAQISVGHWRGGTCYSDPGLYETILVY